MLGRGKITLYKGSCRLPNSPKDEVRVKISEYVKFSNKALKVEDETSLAFMHGKKFLDHPLNKSNAANKPRVRLQLISFTKFLLKRLSLKSISVENCKILIYTGTTNQLISVETTIKQLDKSLYRKAIALDEGTEPPSWLKNREIHLVRFDLFTIVASIFLLMARSPKLYFKFKKIAKEEKVNFGLKKFFLSYPYIIYFYNLITSGEPDLILMSNDHNVSNRCLRLVGEILGVNTMYMQHASVSCLFPPLEFDYALLDGESSEQIYEKCYADYNEKPDRMISNHRKCQVILTGQKKHVQRPPKAKGNTSIGIAVNNLDEFEKVEELIQKLLRAGASCTLRTHPAQSRIFVDKLKSLATQNNLLSMSDPKTESLRDFFGRINCLVAGNTSIHLEAALSGLKTFYLEFGAYDIHDYYGYVRNGISYQLSLSNLGIILRAELQSEYDEIRNGAIQKYSSTFGTAWQNREGQLAAKIIEKILDGENLADFIKTLP